MEFLVPIAVGFIGSFFGRRRRNNNQVIYYEDNTRLNELISQNKKLMDEINQSREMENQKKEEEAKTKIKKKENDDKKFDENINEFNNKIKEVVINPNNNDEYKLFCEDLKNIIKKINEFIIDSSTFSVKLKSEMQKMVEESSLLKEEINNINIMIIGKTGTGKTTLANQICPTFQGIESMGRVGNKCTIKYECKCDDKKHCFINIIDTRGVEINKDFGPESVRKETEKYIENQLKLGKPNEAVHVIIYCITGTRAEEKELAVLKNLRNVYKEKNIPIIIVYTQSVSDQLTEEFKNVLNDLLEKEYGERIGDNPEKIRFIDILAKEKKLRRTTIKPYNVSKLLKMCYQGFNYSCRLTLKRCLYCSTKDELLKKINTNIENNPGINIFNDLFSYFFSIFNSMCPFQVESNGSFDSSIKDAKEKTLNYIKTQFDNFKNKQLEEICLSMISEENKFYSEHQNFNLGDSFKNKDYWKDLASKEIDNKFWDDFSENGFIEIWKEMKNYIIESFKKLIEIRVDQFMQTDVEFQDNLLKFSSCKVKTLKDEMNNLIKEIHQKEDNNDEEISDLEDDEVEN